MGVEIDEWPETTPEISLSGRPTSPLEFGQNVHPPTPINELDNLDLELIPPPPADIEMAQGVPPSPPLASITSIPGPYNLSDDRWGNPSLDPDGDIPPPDSGSDDDGSLDSDEENDADPSLPLDSNGNDPPLDPEEEEEDVHITLEKQKIDYQFINMAKTATLESQFTPEELWTFRNPQEELFSPMDDPDLYLSVEAYVASLNHAQSQRGYATSRSIILKHFPGSEMLSYDQVKRRVSKLSGLITWKHDMCYNSCAAFTGPYENLEICPYPRCLEPRYNQDVLEKSGGKKKVPRKQFTTFALGPQLQARWKSPQMVEKMYYRRKKTWVEQEDDRDSDDYIFDDIFCGSDYLDAVEQGNIKDDDMVVMLSIDGAQLYRNKKSDCWIYIWIILDLAPDLRYKIRNILPGGIIPGPGHPKYIDSFLFPGLSHVSAIQREGLRVYDSYHRKVFTSFIFVLLALADAIAMAELSGSVGHHGRKGCRLLCEFVGRNKPNGSHYYPALLRPLGTHKASCNHPDIIISNLPPVDPLKYRQNLINVITSRTDAEYQWRRLETGIRKPSIFDCLSRCLEPPTCFPSDIMHQPVINLVALMIDLWLNREGCRKGDPKGIWDWILDEDVWTALGKAVADAARFFPRSFDRTPRNPALKLNSGYKATELLLWFYGLGPGIFFDVLKEEYYRHYCKLVVAVRIIYQRRISRKFLLLAHKLLLEWVLEFELLYYQRKVERLHFVRQCVHSLTHLGPETARLGPPSLSAQWTMERIIGIFGSLIKQPSNPFANLAEQAKKIAEINALVSIWPELEAEDKDPHGSIDIGDGYLLLGPKDDKPYELSQAEQSAVQEFYSSQPNHGTVPPKSIYRWGRLRISTEQVARSRWKEVDRSSRAARTDWNLWVSDFN